jgi:hypothetical protein
MRLLLQCRLKPFFMDEKFASLKPIITLPEAISRGTACKKARLTGAALNSNTGLPV